MDLKALIEKLELAIEEIREEIDRLDNYSGRDYELFQRLKETQRQLEIAKSLQN